MKREVEPHIPVLDCKRQTDGKITRDAFRYEAETDRYICPQGHGMALTGIHEPTGVKQYKAPATACRDCPIKSSCTDGKQRAVTRLVHEQVREKVQALATTEAFAEFRRKRKKAEMLFAHLKRKPGSPSIAPLRFDWRGGGVPPGCNRPKPQRPSLD